MQTYKIGVIGCGQITQGMHLPVLNALPQCELSWAYDVSTRNSALVAEVYKCQQIKCFEQLTEIFPDTDIILLAVPYGVREPFYELLKNADKKPALFVEKPFAKTVKEHEWITSLLPPHKIACNYQRRYDSRLQLVKELIQEKLLGELRGISFSIAGLGGLSVGDKYYSDASISGGGMLMEIGVHYIDALLYCTNGRPIDDVSGKMIIEEGFDLHTEVKCSVELEDGAKIPFNYLVSVLKDGGNYIQLDFENHSISVSLFSADPVSLTKKGSSRIFHLSPDQAVSSDVSVARIWADFIEGISTGVANSTSATTSIGVTSLIEASYQL